MARLPSRQGSDAARSGGPNREPSRVPLDIDAHDQVIGWQDLREALSPLHQGEPWPGFQALLQADPVEFITLEAVDVGVQQRETALVLRDQDEGRADDVFSNSKPIAYALAKAGLTGSEIATQRHNGSRRCAGSKSSAQALGR